jgi:hypothetical protein
MMKKKLIKIGLTTSLWTLIRYMWLHDVFFTIIDNTQLKVYMRLRELKTYLEVRV